MTALTTKGDLLTNVGSGPEDVIDRQVTGELPRHAGTARATINSEPLQHTTSHTEEARAHEDMEGRVAASARASPGITVLLSRCETDRRTDGQTRSRPRPGASDRRQRTQEGRKLEEAQQLISHS